MPPIVAGIGAASALLTSTAIGSLIVQTVSGLAINAVVGLAINAFLPEEAPAAAFLPEIVSGSEFDLSTGPATVDVLFGRGIAKNHLWYHNWYGDDNQFGQVVYRQGYGEYDALESVLIDRRATTLSGSNADPRGQVVDAFKVDAEGNPSPGGTPNCWVKYYTGAAGQVADPELITNARPAGRWAATDKMTGMPYVIVTYRYNSNLFAGGLPQLNFLWRGIKQYDRRKDDTQSGGLGAHRFGDPSTYEWSENPAICQDNWRLGIWVNNVRVLGLGVRMAECHHARTVAAANLSDEDVYYADSALTHNRYVFGSVIRDGVNPINVMRGFEAAMGGFGFEEGGAYGPLPAQTEIDVMTIIDNDLVRGAPSSFKTRLSPLETKNAFHGTFTSPEFQWRVDEYGMRYDLAVETADLGRRLGRMDFPQVNVRETASSLAEIARRRDLYSAVESIVLGPKAAVLQPGDTILRQSDGVLGSLSMMVMAKRELPAMQHQIVLREWSNDIIPSPSSGFVTIPTVPAQVPAPAQIIAVSGFELEAVTYNQNGTEVPALRATWLPIADPTVDRVIIKYWPLGASNDARYLPVDDPFSGRVVIEGVLPETSYQAVALISTTPARATIATNTASATTGVLGVAVAVADGSIDFTKLNLELQNLSGTWMPRLFERMDEFEVLLGDMAQTVMDNTMLSKGKVTGLRVANASASATVLRIEKVLVEGGGALADLEESVLATFAEFTGGSSVRWHSEAGTDGASANLVLQVFSEGQGGWGSAGLMLQTFTDAPSRMVNWADQIIWTDGTEYATPAVFENGILYLGELKVKLITSPDGETMVLDAIAPSFEMTSSS